MNVDKTAWSMNELGTTLAKEFRGKQVFLWADCCYSGGMHVVVDALAKRQVAAFSLTSAGTANASTTNWTFTQSIIDGLRGEPIVDANADGQVTLVELRNEVGEAMKHREGQAHGFKANGVAEDFVLAKAAGAARAEAAKRFRSAATLKRPAVADATSVVSWLPMTNTSPFSFTTTRKNGSSSLRLPMLSRRNASLKLRPVRRRGEARLPDRVARHVVPGQSNEALDCGRQATLFHPLPGL